MHYLFVAALIAGLQAQPPVSTESPTVQPFRPINFFTGPTIGKGRLKVLISPTSDVTVRGSGRVEADGTLVLDQLVVRAGHKQTKREWRLRETSPGHYSGTLSDAVGGVAGDVTGDDFHLRYRLKSGVHVDQHLVLDSDRDALANRMAFRKFGVVVARMRETIRRP